MEIEDLLDASVFLLTPGRGAEQVAEQQRPDRELAVSDERHQEAVQVPGAGRDVEDRVDADGEVAVQLRRPWEGCPGEGRPGDRLPDHPPDALDAGLEDRVVDVRDDPERRGVTRDPYFEWRDHRVRDAAILLGELDGPAGPRGGEPARVWLQAYLEVAVGVGGGLDGGACDGDA